MTTGAVAAACAFGVYRTYREAVLNTVLVSVNEYVALSGSDTDSFTDLSSMVEGEIRVESNTLAVYKYLLRLNAFFLEINLTSPVGRDGRRRTAVEVPSNSVPLGDVVVNEIVEASPMESKQHIVFTPACASRQVLVQYKTRVHEQFIAPVSVRDCVASSVGSGQIRLSFALTIHAAVLDLELVFCLPKQAKALTVNTDGVGSWKLSKTSDREIIWSIGACGTGSADRGGETASLATVPANVQEQQRRLFGGHHNSHKSRSATQQSPERVLADETVMMANLDDYPHAELGSFMERIHFDMVYVVDVEGATNVDGESAARTKGKKKHNDARRHREEDAFDAADPPPAPGVGLSYAIAATASALTVKKLQVIEERRTWDPKDHWFWRSLARVLTHLPQVPKLCRKAQYTTRVSQAATVEVQY